MATEIKSEPEAADRLFTTSFILVITANFANALGAQMTSSILPVYVVSFGGTQFQAGIITGFLAFTALLLRPLIGWLVDAWRRRPMVLIGTSCYAASNILYSLFGSFTPLLFSRVIHGFGLSSYTTASSAFLADICPPTRRAEGMGYYSVVMDIGLLGGPALAFFLVNHAGMQKLFYLTAALSFTAFLISIPVRERRAPRVGPLPTWKFKTGVISKPAFPAAWMAFCLGMGVGPVMAFIAIFSRQRGVENPGLFFTTQAVALMVSRTFSGRLSDRRGRISVIVPGLLCMSAGLLVLPLAGSLMMLLVCAALIGLGFGSCQPATMALAVDFVPPDERGMAVSTYFIGFDAGIAMGSIALGGIVDLFNFNVMWIVAAVLVSCGMFAIMKMPKPAA